MDGKNNKEEENNNNDNYESDLTKDAFFSDMENIEEEIASEAYSIVEHALTLIQSGYFDDAIEVLRQAIGLYEQIKKEAEINALRAKIADVYIMKESSFKQEESEKILESSIEVLDASSPKEMIKKDINISNLLMEASKLIDSNQFDDALDIYDEIILFLQQMNHDSQIVDINNLIEECYNKKAQFLRQKNKIESIEKIIEPSNIGGELSEEAIKAHKLKAYEEAKQREEKISNEAYDIIGKASDLAKLHQYDGAINLYNNGASLFDEIGWVNESKKIRDTILFLQNEREKYLQEIERIKAQEKKKEMLKKQKAAKLIDSPRVQEDQIIASQAERIAQIATKKQEEEFFQKKISEMIDEAEKLARDYDVSMKKAIKKGELLEECIYPRVIHIYEEIRDKVNEKGWKNQVAIYTDQIKKFTDLLAKDLKIRQIEAEKIQKQKEYEESHKIKVPELLDTQQVKHTQELRMNEQEDIEYKNQIEFMASRAEKLARDYDSKFKKAIKEGNLTLESKYPDIINIYSRIIEMAKQKGWSEDVAIYNTQIRKYKELYEKENKVRKLELQKLKEKRAFEESYKLQMRKDNEREDIDKLKEIQAKTEQEDLEVVLEQEIDKMVNAAEKMAREYEVAIKRGNFDLECPYSKIVDIYKEIRQKVYARGWQGEAELYANQIRIYQEKNHNDIKLRNLEEEKRNKQLLYKKAMKAPQTDEPSKYIELKAAEEKVDQTELIFNQAMDIINKTENEVKSYELSLKKEILNIHSPYDKAIKNYEEAKKLLLQIGWKDEALKLNNTISLYQQKKARDDNLRDMELEKKRKEASITEKPKEFIKEPFFEEEEKRIELEKLKKQKSIEADFIFELINRAEKMAQEYDLRKKEDLLNIKSPYHEIINTYKVAKQKFEEIGWTEQASQLINTIEHYKEKMITDERLRALEQERIRKEEEDLHKMKIESKLARDAEAELLKQKVKALEIKKKQQLEYEGKKEQAFNFMDLAKKELSQKNFEKAINFYKESEKIFTEINWPEGRRMIGESVNIIKKKKEKYEQEQKYLVEREVERKRIESEIKQQISKAQDLKKMQEEQRKQEFLELQKEKEKEREISDQAYKLLGEGTKLKDKKKFEAAYEKYIMGRNLFEKLEWQHEVSRINNDLLFILKKEMKQTEKIKAMQEKKVEEQKELEVLLKEADIKQQELEKVRKEEKRKQREKIIQEEMEETNLIIKDLKYNEAILKLKRVIRKLEKIGNEKLIKQIKSKIKILENASQVPLITIEDLEKSEYIEKYKLAFKALDKAQLSLSKNLFMRAISELNEAIFNLEETKLGDKYIPLLNEKIDAYKKELGIVESSKPEVKEKLPKTDTDDLRARIAARRAERRKKIRDLMEE